MRNRTFWLVALLWLAAALWIFPALFRPSDVPIPEPDVLLKKAQVAEQAAGQDKDKLKDAVKKYEQLAKIKQYKKTEYAASARLRVGIIQETKLEDEHAAVRTYTSLVKDFPSEKSAAARDAKDRLTRLQTEIDTKKSKEIGYRAIDALVAMTGRNPAYSYAIALLIITLIFKFVTTPLSHAQFKSMREMQKVQPLVKQLQETYKGDQKEMGKKMMALYKEHGVNPFSSCLPLLAQMPILMLLYYKVILPYQFQFTKGGLLWIGSGLSHKFPSIVAANLSEPDIPLLLIYTVSMIISQKLSVVDPSQAEQQKIMTYTMPILFAFIFRTFPSAFMLYWLFFNITSTVQQYYVLKQPGGPAGPAAGAVAEEQGKKPAEKPKRPPTRPGKKGKRRRKRFEAVRIQRPTWLPIPGS